MLQVSHFSKKLKVESPNKRGIVKVFFGSPKAYKILNKLTFPEFIALSNLLENDTVFYDPKSRMFVTSTEVADFESYEQKLVK